MPSFPLIVSVPPQHEHCKYLVNLQKEQTQMAGTKAIFQEVTAARMSEMNTDGKSPISIEFVCTFPSILCWEEAKYIETFNLFKRKTQIAAINLDKVNADCVSLALFLAESKFVMSKRKAGNGSMKWTEKKPNLNRDSFAERTFACLPACLQMLAARRA